MNYAMTCPRVRCWAPLTRTLASSAPIVLDLIMVSILSSTMLMAEDPKPGQVNSRPATPACVSEPARTYLENLQREAYEHHETRLPAPLTVEQIVRAIRQDPLLKRIPEALASPAAEKVRARYEAHLLMQNEQLIKDLSSLKVPSRFENPAFYLILTRLRDRVAAAAAHHPEYPLPARSVVVFGTDPSFRANAWVTPVSCTGDRAAVFRDDLFDASFHVMKVLTQVLGWGEHDTSFAPKEIAKGVKDPQLRAYFVHLMKWYVGRPDPPQEYKLHPVREHVSALFVQSMEMWAIGHELAHVALKHKAKNCNIPCRWQQELQADWLGYDFMRLAQENDGTPEEQGLGLWGGLLMLEVMDILERAASIADRGVVLPQPPKDPAEIRMVHWVVACLKVPDGDECKNYVPDTEDMEKDHPPNWFREIQLRKYMQSGSSLKALFPDDWTFEDAIHMAGMTLLEDATPYLIPGSQLKPH